MIDNLNDVKSFIESADNILVIQADNPDGDSLATSLALEHILGDMGKNVYMYCGVEVPGYLKFLTGWDRVSKEIPMSFDASIIVDTSAVSLLEKLEQSPEKMWVASRPVMVLDHHQEVQCNIPYASLVVSPMEYASTGEVLYDICKSLDWTMSLQAQEFITQSILSDSLGLTSDIATSNSYRRIADMIDAGVSRSKLEEARRAYSKMDIAVFEYKSDLMKRTEFFSNDSVALTIIPESELFDVGTLYNPGPLINSELMMVNGVKVAIALKIYKNRATGSIRCTDGASIAHKIADYFGGGGHPFAAGFKIDDFDGNIDALKNNIISKTNELLSQND